MTQDRLSGVNGVSAGVKAINAPQAILTQFRKQQQREIPAVAEIATARNRVGHDGKKHGEKGLIP